MTKDNDHLKLVVIFHYVFGGVTGVFSLLPVIHLIIGIAFILGVDGMESGGEAPPAFFGWIFAIIGGGMMLLGLSLATCMLIAGRMLARRRHYVFCLVIAALECILMPLGTILGVFTIIVLMRDSVKDAFAANDSPEELH